MTWDMGHCHKYVYPIYLYGLGIKNVCKIHYAAPDYRIENLNNGDSELTNKILFQYNTCIKKNKEFNNLLSQS